MRRFVRFLSLLVLALLVTSVAVVAVLARTTWGHERVRQLLVSAVGGAAHGRVVVNRVSGDLLGKFTLNGVSITDSAGDPFLTVQDLSARLSLPALLRKQVHLSDVALNKPDIVLTQDVDGRWNYERIFPKDTLHADTTRGWGDWVSIGQASLASGHLRVQRPWHPDDPRARRDSSLVAALADSSSLQLERHGGEWSQVMTMEQIGGVVARSVVADPSDPDMHFQIDSLSAIVRMLKPGPFNVRKASADVRVTHDSVVVTKLKLKLPGTDGEGAVLVNSKRGDIEATLHIPSLSFADIRPLYPPLPERGTGRMDLQLAVHDSAPSEYIVTNADLRSDQAVVSGALGLTIGDSVTRFSNTDVRFTRVSTALVQRLVPSAASPFPASLDGTATIDGPIESMQLNVRSTVRPASYPAFRVAARGGLGVVSATAPATPNVRANGRAVRSNGSDAPGTSAVVLSALHLSGENIPLSLAKAFKVEQPVGGVISLNGVASGSSAGRIFGQFNIRHAEHGDSSRITVRGNVAFDDSTRMQLTARMHDVSLALLNDVVDSLGAVGRASGRIQLRGTPRDVEVTTVLRLPGDALVRGKGELHTSPHDSARYRGDITLEHLAPREIVPTLPVMIVDGTTTFDGRGLSPASLTASLRTRLTLFMIDSAEVRNVVVDAHAAEGLLHVDSLSGQTSFGSFAAGGTFGLAEGHDGHLTYRARVEDLGGLRRWISGQDTTVIAARPGIRRRAERRRARADSIRFAERARRDPAAALAAAMNGDSTIRRRTRVPQPAPIARDSASGAFTVDGALRGNAKRAALSATLKTPGVVWGGSLFGAGTIRASWSGAFTPNDTIRVDGGVDSVRLAGFAFDSTRFGVSYRRGLGEATLAMFPGDTAEYRVSTEFALYPDSGQVRLQDLRLSLDSTRWRSIRPSVISWQGHGIRIDSLELQDQRAGSRLFANGVLYEREASHLEIVADRVRLAPWLSILQSDVDADGLLSSTIEIAGSQKSPEFSGKVAVTDARYGATPFPRLDATANYKGSTLQLEALAYNDKGIELARAVGTLPMNLASADSLAKRLPDSAPISIRITGDSIPLAPLVELTDAVREVEGTAHGDVTIGGTWSKPQATGGIGLTLGKVRVVSNGVLLSDVVGQLRFSADSLLVDSLRASSEGQLTASGSVLLSPLLNPRLHLTLETDEARILDDDRGELFATGAIKVEGPLDSLGVTGNVAVVRGVVFVPDPEKFKVINTQDAALFALTDTATVQALGLGADSEIMRNMRIDVVVEVRRGTFARSADANVEVYGDLRVRTEPPKVDFIVTGALHSDRGSYTLYGKRFDVSGGTVRFVGGDELNPSLQLLATYQVQQAGRAPLEIRVVIGGTLDRPSISLESDAQPTLSQSDLISFLAFGRSSSSLLQFSGTGLEGGGAGGSSLAGNVAALARRQLASIAIGAMIDEIRSELANATRADVLNITPAQLPADVSLGGLETVLRGTEIEFGRYLNERTFVLGRIRPSLTLPGAFVEHRLSPHLLARASVETRLQATTPSLSKGVTPRSLQIIGALMTWSFSW